MVDECITDPVIKKRCRYIIEENTRLLEGCKDLERNDLESFGKKMYQSHAGLRDLYEVSCKELDFIEAECAQEKDIIGARMMGGGFGGCVIAIMKEKSIDAITDRIMNEYKNKLGKELKVYITRIDSGTGLIQ